MIRAKKEESEEYKLSRRKVDGLQTCIERNNQKLSNYRKENVLKIKGSLK
jgi:hypothetical protein